MKVLLEVRNVHSGYGKLHILYDISYQFKEKYITVIVGPNGSGKSTFLKTVFGLTNIYSGNIIFDEDDITKVPPHERTKLGIAYLPQLDNVFSKLTVAENLKMAGYTLDSNVLRDRIEEILSRFPLLKERWNQRAGTLSGGQRQLLAMGMALLRRPKLMMFDEPTGALSPGLSKMILNRIEKLRDELDITIILVEQNAKVALQMGEEAILMVSGHMRYTGKAIDLLRNPELGKLYLGIKK
ncbi:MAG: ABC transporter ATP-binding protein [Desulfurococcales archaeon]|nr:ABC transporter ATP-binding protein [Desulfurococcales archaeon]